MNSIVPTVAHDDPSSRPNARPAKGPVRLLCDEIGFKFDPRMERPDVLVAFVRQLVGQVEHMRWISAKVAAAGGQPPSAASAEVLGLAADMLEQADRASLVLCAGAVHDAARELNPEGAYPTDHLIDMLSSCASAIRFGLETPCHSRHAAAAAQHVWKRLYGVSLFDSHTGAWENEWARSKLLSAIVSLLPAPLSDGALGRQDGSQPDQRYEPESPSPKNQGDAETP